MSQRDEETSWPEDGGRSYARGTWASIGPFVYRSRRWQIATKVTVLMVLASMAALGVWELVSALTGS